MKIRLHQFLSKTGVFDSKWDVDQAIKKREITIDGKVCTKIHFQLKPKKVQVAWKGKPIQPIDDFIYILMNKPTGYLSSKLSQEDKRLGKKSLFDLLVKVESDYLNTLFCVGRLDEMTSGLILITNDGHLSNLITQPENEIEKVYEVTLWDTIDDHQIHQIEKGTVINLEEDGRITPYNTKSCKIEKTGDKALKIALREGKKREVRRLFETVGNKVKILHRLSIGAINCENLEIGQYKEVDQEYILSRIK